MAFIEPMHRNKPNITYLAILTLCFMVLVLSLGHHVAVSGISYLLIVAIVSGQCLVTVPVVQPSSTMDGGEGEVTKRVTRQSVSEASAATEQTSDSFEDFVRKSLTSMGAKMDSILAGQAALEKRCDSIETRVTQNETVIQDTIVSLDFNSDQVKDLSSEIASIKKQLKDFQLESQQARISIATLQSESNNLQRYTRSYNVRFLGIPEKEKEECVVTVEDLMSQYFDVPAGSIENAHRVGQSSGGKPRQIIARFYSRVTRRLVMTSAREVLAGTGFRLVDDLTPKDLEAKRRVLPYMEKLYADNKKPRFINGRLYSEGRPVPLETINAFLDKNWVNIPMEHYITFIVFS